METFHLYVLSILDPVRDGIAVMGAILLVIAVILAIGSSKPLPEVEEEEEEDDPWVPKDRWADDDDDDEEAEEYGRALRLEPSVERTHDTGAATIGKLIILSFCCFVLWVAIPSRRGLAEAYVMMHGAELLEAADLGGFVNTVLGTNTANTATEEK